MANSCIWDPACSALKMTLVPPSKPIQTKGSASVGLSFAQPGYNKNVQDYTGVPPDGTKGSNYAESKSYPGGITWNYEGPVFGAAETVIYFYPQYMDSEGVWQKFPAPPTQSENTWTYEDPRPVTNGNAGDTSITVSMIDPGGGGLSL